MRVKVHHLVWCPNVSQESEIMPHCVHLTCHFSAVQMSVKNQRLCPTVYILPAIFLLSKWPSLHIYVPLYCTKEITNVTPPPAWWPSDTICILTPMISTHRTHTDTIILWLWTAKGVIGKFAEDFRRVICHDTRFPSTHLSPAFKTRGILSLNLKEKSLSEYCIQV